MQWKNKAGEWEKMSVHFFARKIGGFFLWIVGFHRIKHYGRQFMLRMYKRKKVKTSKSDEEKFYTIHFNIIIDDEDVPVTIGPFDIEIPATAMFFAKKKLKNYLLHKIDIQVIDFEVADKSNSDDEEGDRCGSGLDSDKDDGLRTSGEGAGV